MDITTVRLQPYIGGQLEIQSPGEGYILRGEIADAIVEDRGEDPELQITFVWLAKGEGYPPIPTKWVAEERTDYAVSLFMSREVEVDSGRLCIIKRIGEVLVFFPPDGSRLDPAEVEGLQLKSA